MARLYDEVMYGRVPIAVPPWVSGLPSSNPQSRILLPKVKERYANYVVFDITNVAHYIWCETPQEQFLVGRDFPCPAPPYNKIWMEYKRPPYINSEEFGRLEVIGEFFPPRTVVEVDTWSMEEGSNGLAWTKSQMDVRYKQATMAATVVSKSFQTHEIKTEPGKIIKRLKEDVMSSKWLVRMCFYSESNFGSLVGPMEELFYWLDSKGEVVDCVFQWPYLHHPPDSEKLRHYDAMFYPALMALSMMNCRNVKQVDNKPPVKLAKATLRRKGYIPVTYKTIVIDHLKSVAARHDESGQKTGIKRAMHICRGHFAEYGGPKGKLFGKIEGRFWIPQHIRGSEDEGVIVKDYEVK